MEQEMESGNAREPGLWPQKKLSPLVLSQLLKNNDGNMRAAVLPTLITMRNDLVMPDPKELLPDIRRDVKG